jgi:class 3 adenylate cyclase
MSTAALMSTPAGTARTGQIPARRRRAADCGPERRRASVLFVDVEGSMGLSDTVELEDWWSAIDELFALLCDGVRRYGGWIANFTGDGVAAVFDGYDERPGEHARRACEAAQWLCEVIRGRGAEMWRERGLELSVRTGIHSGEVLVGTIGDPRERRYTMAGYAVALAKRIEGLATPGRAWVSEQTAALAGDAVTLRDRGCFAIKGAPVPVRVFELA